MLNPVFSTKHLREMTPLFYEIIHKVRLPGPGPAPVTHAAATICRPAMR